MSNTGSRGGVGGSYDACGGRRPRSFSSGSPCYASSEGRSSAVVLQESEDSQARESTPSPPSQAFPISHLLEFGPEARAERHELSACLSSQVGVSESTALAALEAFGMDAIRARQWLEASLLAQQVRVGLALELVVLIWRRRKF